MGDLTTGAVERHLDALFDSLAGTGAAGRRALAEAEDHLHSAVAEGMAGGLSRDEAEREAVARFGRPCRIATGVRVANGGLAALVRPAFIGAWAVGAVLLLGIGFSGLLAELFGRVFGMAFVAGDGPDVAYTASRCAEFQEYFPHASCGEAAMLHHFGEIVQYRVAAGVLGLLALAALVLARRVSVLGAPRWTPPRGMVAIVLVALFGVAGALLGGYSLMGLVFGVRDGIGGDLSAGLVAICAALAVMVWALRGATLQPE